MNNVNPDDMPIYKHSANNPKYSDEIWAQLMVDAISAFNQGLEGYIEPEHNRVAQNFNNKLYEDAVDLVGSEAFETIATIIASTTKV